MWCAVLGYDAATAAQRPSVVDAAASVVSSGRGLAMGNGKDLEGEAAAAEHLQYLDAVAAIQSDALPAAPSHENYPAELGWFYGRETMEAELG